MLRLVGTDPPSNVIAPLCPTGHITHEMTTSSAALYRSTLIVVMVLSFLSPGALCHSQNLPACYVRPHYVSPLNSVTGSLKFVRVVSTPRSGKPKTPRITKRAAVTTHTSVDGSQIPWGNCSQLPDTEPDSGKVAPKRLINLHGVVLHR